MSMKTKIEVFEIIDHGADHSQYFQGCDVSHSEYTDVATGIGDTPAEALDDALDQLASAGFDVSPIDDTPANKLEWLGVDYDSRSAHVDCEPEGCANETGECDHTECAPEGRHDECELRYFVSVRVRAATDDATARSQAFDAGNYCNAYETTDWDAAWSKYCEKYKAHDTAFLLGFFASYELHEIADEIVRAEVERARASEGGES